jgi:hypothetical protein
MIPQEQTCATPDNHELGALVYLLTMTPESWPTCWQWPRRACFCPVPLQPWLPSAADSPNRGCTMYSGVQQLYCHL